MPRSKRASHGTAPGYRVHFYCPGCEDVHAIVTGTPDGWGFNGNYESPTFTPSVLVRAVQWGEEHESTPFERRRAAHPGVKAGDQTVCHSFVTDGRIQFLGDCTHHLVGQTVDLPQWGDR
jgi:hypothetical protein